MSKGLNAALDRALAAYDAEVTGRRDEVRGLHAELSQLRARIAELEEAWRRESVTLEETRDEVELKQACINGMSAQVAALTAERDQLLERVRTPDEDSVLTILRAQFLRSPQWFRQYLPTLHDALEKVEQAETDTVLLIHRGGQVKGGPISASHPDELLPGGGTER